MIAVIEDNSIHVVVEDSMSLAVATQEAVCVRNSKIFKVKKTVWIMFAYELDESRKKVRYEKEIHQVAGNRRTCPQSYRTPPL